jgi:acyl-CoA reductase-like NAD-dependent aldehyde dehydrogenase
MRMTPAPVPVPAPAPETQAANQAPDPTGSALARAGMMVERAHWAAEAFARFGRERVLKIAEAVAEAGFAKAQHYGEWAVREGGFGVAEHKRIKNELCSRGLYRHYKDLALVGMRVDRERKIVELARPAGVVFALTPSTNPVSTVFFKIICALLTRNAIIISPHPYTKQCCADAAKLMAEAAVKAGAPDGVIQVIEEPTIDLVTSVMRDPRIDVILATGGSPMVRAAYSSGNPALGVGPGNAPVLVDASADLAKAAQRIVMSKSFDNSVLCTNESVLIAEEAIADKLVRHMRQEGAHLCADDERDRLREYLFPKGHFNTKALGRDAAWIAGEAGFKVPGKTKILLAPFALAVPEEMLCHEKLCPVLGFHVVPHVKRGIDVARAVIRYSGAGHSAAIHSRNPRTIMAYSVALKVLRVAVNTPCSTGASGFDTNLAPSMTIGTGFFGRSALGENFGPQHLVNWTRVAYDKTEAMGDFDGLDPWAEIEAAPEPAHSTHADAVIAEMREEIRRVVVEELRQILVG